MEKCLQGRKRSYDDILKEWNSIDLGCNDLLTALIQLRFFETCLKQWVKAIDMKVLRMVCKRFNVFFKQCFRTTPSYTNSLTFQALKNHHYILALYNINRDGPRFINVMEMVDICLWALGSRNCPYTSLGSVMYLAEREIKSEDESKAFDEILKIYKDHKKIKD
jgi:hypothetical protein